MTMTNQIQLVALDVDGTLVTSDQQIPPATRAAIRMARERGARFAIVTGRMYQAAAPLARELELEGMPLVAFNGALIKEFPSGKTLFQQPLAVEPARAAAAYCEARGYYVHAYVADKLYVPEGRDLGLRYAQRLGVEAHPVASLSRWLQEPPTKLLVVEEVERTPAIQRELADLLGSSASVVRSDPEYVEIFSPNVSKGQMLSVLAEEMGLTSDQVMAVGDGWNDVEMLAWAGTSFAVCHAAEEVRRAATFVTRSGPGDAVAEALRRVGLAD
jgi:Cof subfamily protein (haloacid dehalogenase superfamily)